MSKTLEQRIAHLESRLLLNDDTDSAIEIAIQTRQSLGEVLHQLLPLLVKHLDANAAFIRTLDETHELTDFSFHATPEQRIADWPVGWDEIARDRLEADQLNYRVNDDLVIAQRVDVAGEDFGTAAVWFHNNGGDIDLDDGTALLDTWCEELDNYLASIALARQKVKITREISDALKEPVLDTGIERGIDALRRHVGFDHLLLAFQSGTVASGMALHFKLILDGRLVLDSEHSGETQLTGVEGEIHRWLVDGESDWLQRFDINTFCDQVMIQGVRDERVVGRLLVARRLDNSFHTFARDLISSFADYLRMRIVDFNREWKHLSLCFPPDTVTRLLCQDRYVQRYLTPRSRDVAVLHSDITGFTRLSEQVLVDPELIGELIDTWGKRVVEIIWDTGGVFDKMVGDCIIGIWGPPFYEMSAQETCRAAALAAERVRDYTRSLGDGKEIPALRGISHEMGVATGLNYCPLHVGRYGPNENFTGFSSGMNNTARLQGVAARDEILCMDGFVDAYGDIADFGEERTALVKNVEAPLRFRTLDRAI